MEPTFSVFCIVCFLQHVTNQYLVNIVSRWIHLLLVCLLSLADCTLSSLLKVNFKWTAPQGRGCWWPW